MVKKTLKLIRKYWIRSKEKVNKKKEKVNKKKGKVNKKQQNNSNREDYNYLRRNALL